jgi:hypothetical protein
LASLKCSPHFFRFLQRKKNSDQWIEMECNGNQTNQNSVF